MREGAVVEQRLNIELVRYLHLSFTALIKNKSVTHFDKKLKIFTGISFHIVSSQCKTRAHLRKFYIRSSGDTNCQSMSNSADCRSRIVMQPPTVARLKHVDDSLAHIGADRTHQSHWNS